METFEGIHNMCKGLTKQWASYVTVTDLIRWLHQYASGYNCTHLTPLPLKKSAKQLAEQKELPGESLKHL